MPKEVVPRSPHHSRRHSGLCPESVISQEHSEGHASPIQMMVKPRSCHHTKSGYHHDCHCEAVRPVENLDERYGLVEEPEEILQQRHSLEKEAADRVAEIMHAELVADMEAAQCRL